LKRFFRYFLRFFAIFLLFSSNFAVFSLEFLVKAVLLSVKRLNSWLLKLPDRRCRKQAARQVSKEGFFFSAIFRLRRRTMAQKIKKVGVSKEKGYLYYLGKDGNVWRSKMARAGKGGGGATKIAAAGVAREAGFLYFIDKDGDVARSPMARGR